jgi:hypothetical protein
VVEYVERAVAVADFKLKRLSSLGVADPDRDVAVMGVPAQLNVDAIAGAAVEFAWRRGGTGVVRAD